jgi:hypothetical protein
MDPNSPQGQATVTEIRPTAVQPPGVKRPLIRRTGRLVGAVAAGWVVSGLTTVLRIDWVLLPLLVLTVAAVLRTGRNVLDRLMFATLIVTGALVVGGLLFSLWPWGLAPFPVSGAAFTVVALAAWLGGRLDRLPRMPRAFSASDLMIVGTGVFTFLAELRPLLGRSYVARFPFNATSEDRSAHFALFDTIHRLGTFPFFDQAAARVSLQTPTEADYPAATHYLYAIIDIFLRSSTDPGPAIAEFNRYFLYVIAGYAALLISVLWAARRVAAPYVRGWRLFAALAVTSAILIGGPYLALVTSGFDSQVLGLAFVGLTLAVAVRPPASLTERLLALGAGIILVSYTYYLYLPFAAIAVVVSLWFDRRLVRRAWRPIACAALFVGAVAVLPVYFAATSKLDVGAQVLSGGAMFRPSRSVTIAATVASLAPLATAMARRHRQFKVIGLSVSASFVLTLLFGLYQRLSLGKTSYYFEKLLTVHLVMALVCAATLAMFLNPLVVADRDPRRARLREVALGVIATALAFTSIAGFGFGMKTFGPRTGEWSNTSLGRWFGTQQWAVGTATSENLMNLAKKGVLADGTTTLFLVSNDAYVNWRLSFANGTFNRTNGLTMLSINKILKIRVDGRPEDQPLQPSEVQELDWSALDQKQADRVISDLAEAVSLSPRPVRIVVGDPAAVDAIREGLAAKPSAHATVLLVTKP